MMRYATKIESDRPIRLGTTGPRILRWSESWMIWADMRNRPQSGSDSFRRVEGASSAHSIRIKCASKKAYAKKDQQRCYHLRHHPLPRLPCWKGTCGGM